MSALDGKREGYRFGVRWIAENDEDGWTSGDPEQDAEAISGFVSTLLLADLFGKDPDVVARDVVRIRESARSAS